MRLWLAGMMAVCGIGKPKGRRNSATTAYQSANPPIAAASAKAATKPNAGWRSANARATTRMASEPANTALASAFTRLKS